MYGTPHMYTYSNVLFWKTTMGYDGILLGILVGWSMWWKHNAINHPFLGIVSSTLPGQTRSTDPSLEQVNSLFWQTDIALVKHTTNYGKSSFWTGKSTTNRQFLSIFYWQTVSLPGRVAMEKATVMFAWCFSSHSMGHAFFPLKMTGWGSEFLHLQPNSAFRVSSWIAFDIYIIIYMIHI